MSRAPTMAAQSLVLAGRPQHEFAVQVPQRRVQRRLVEDAVVVYPAANLPVKHARQVFQGLVAARWQLPTADFLTNALAGFGAHARTEVDEVLAPPILRPSSPERIAQEVEARLGVLTPSVIVLAVHQPRLLRMQRQATLPKSLRQLRQHSFSLRPRTAMAQRIIGIPLKRYVRMMPPHPLIEHVVQEQVGQQRTDHPALRCTQRSHLRLAVGQFYRRLQPAAHIQQHPALAGVLVQRSHQQRMIYGVEESLDVEINDPRIVPAAAPDGPALAAPTSPVGTRTSPHGSALPASAPGAA